MEYTLEKDKIVIHHEKSVLHPEAWDEVYKVIIFKDNVLTVDNITRMNLHKL